MEMEEDVASTGHTAGPFHSTSEISITPRPGAARERSLSPIRGRLTRTSSVQSGVRKFERLSRSRSPRPRAMSPADLTQVLTEIVGGTSQDTLAAATTARTEASMAMAQAAQAVQQSQQARSELETALQDHLSQTLAASHQREAALREQLSATTAATQQQMEQQLTAAQSTFSATTAAAQQRMEEQLTAAQTTFSATTAQQEQLATEFQRFASSQGQELAELRSALEALRTTSDTYAGSMEQRAKAQNEAVDTRFAELQRQVAQLERERDQEAQHAVLLEREIVQLRAERGPPKEVAQQAELMVKMWNEMQAMQRRIAEETRQRTQLADGVNTYIHEQTQLKREPLYENEHGLQYYGFQTAADIGGIEDDGGQPVDPIPPAVTATPPGPSGPTPHPFPSRFSATFRTGGGRFPPPPPSPVPPPTGPLPGPSVQSTPAPAPGLAVQLKPKEPPVFLGRVDDDVHTWLTMVADYLDVSGANEVQRVAYTITLLQSFAREWWTQWLSMHGGVKPTTFHELRHLLIDRFSSNLREETAHATLRHIAQKSGETARAYGARFLMQLGRLSSYDRLWAKQLYLGGLNTHVQELVRNSTASTMEEIMAQAEKVEMVSLYTRQSQASQRGGAGRGQPNSGNNSAQGNGQRGGWRGGRNRRGRGANRGGRGSGRSATPLAPNTQWSQDQGQGQGQCYACGGRGHIARNCPTRLNNTAQAQRGRGRGGRSGGGATAGRGRGGPRNAALVGGSAANAPGGDNVPAPPVDPVYSNPAPTGSGN